MRSIHAHKCQDYGATAARIAWGVPLLRIETWCGTREEGGGHTAESCFSMLARSASMRATGWEEEEEEPEEEPALLLVGR